VVSSSALATFKAVRDDDRFVQYLAMEHELVPPVALLTETNRARDPVRIRMAPMTNE
jgi:hypothetical protein